MTFWPNAKCFQLLKGLQASPQIYTFSFSWVFTVQFFYFKCIHTLMNAPAWHDLVSWPITRQLTALQHCLAQRCEGLPEKHSLDGGMLKTCLKPVSIVFLFHSVGTNVPPHCQRCRPLNHWHNKPRMLCWWFPRRISIFCSCDDTAVFHFASVHFQWTENYNPF